MLIVRFIAICAAVVLAAPQSARATAASCDDYFSCFQNPSSPCPTSDLLLGLTVGAVDGIGDLLCFVGDPKCSCFQGLTNEADPASKSEAWLTKINEIIASCGGGAAGGRSLSGVAFEAASDVCTPSFQADVAPILEASCNVCHLPPLNSGGLNLTGGASALVNVPSTESGLPYVAPGNPAGSYLFHKIAGTQLSVGGSGDRMPQGGQLPQTDIDTIEAWIAGGARP